MKKLRASLPMIALVLGVVAASAFKPVSHGEKYPSIYSWFPVGEGGNPIPQPTMPIQGPENPYGCNGGNIYCCVGSTQVVQGDDGLWYPDGELTKIINKNF